MNVAIIGGGAAGFFAAIHVKINFPNSHVTIFEKSAKVLAKVKISGGGRCNVTNAEQSISLLSKAYPRGGKELKQMFPLFNTKHTIDWFESRNVPLVTQADNCIFPKSQDSQSIIDCFMNEVTSRRIIVKTETAIRRIRPIGYQFQLETDNSLLEFDKVIVTSGGSPKRSGLDWLSSLGHIIEEPVPSLFTFNMPGNPVTKLMGIVVENARTKIKGTEFRAEGPLLVTHWGMSGPAVLVLSSFGARWLAEQGYRCALQVNWVNETNHELVTRKIEGLQAEFGAKQLHSIRPYFLPARLWEFLIEKYAMDPTAKWSDIGKRGVNRIVSFLTCDEYEVSGKTTFKEEFVTCGGVSWNSINAKTMESKILPGLFFAGEVVDVDAITGGYNFQAAWTTAFVAAKLGVEC
jgi:predicted Rossmann fold flavoprotein